MTDDQDYTREEALQVAEVSSLRALVADGWAARVEADNWRRIVERIRTEHLEHGPPGSWKCQESAISGDHRCALCREIDTVRMFPVVLAINTDEG